MRLFPKKNLNEEGLAGLGERAIVQVVECLPSKHEALSSTTSSSKNTFILEKLFFMKMTF
jgi:hypothetical protein